MRKIDLPALGALSVMLSACGGGGGGGEATSIVIVSPAAPTPIALPTPTPTPTPTPAPAATAPANPPSAPSLSASTSTELEKLLRAAQGGAVITLMPGRYDRIDLRDLRFDVPVTITSSDPTSRAELTGANLTRAKGIKLANLRLLNLIPEKLYDFLIQDAENITLDNVLITSVEGGESYTSGPLMIRSSRNITVSNSEIKHVRYGISLLNNQGLSFVGNYFHDIRTDGIRGGGSSDVEIVDNLFSDFLPDSGDHPDAIQFWTSDIKTAASNISITDNLIVRGNGTPMQGVFMRDEVGTLPYQGVIIARNRVIGTMYHGIMVGNATIVKISDNRVTGMADQKSWISVPTATTLTSNSAQVFLIGGVNVSTLSGNTIIPPSNDNGAALAHSWLIGHAR